MAGDLLVQPFLLLVQPVAEAAVLFLGGGPAACVVAVLALFIARRDVDVARARRLELALPPDVVRAAVIPIAGDPHLARLRCGNDLDPRGGRSRLHLDVLDSAPRGNR